MTASTAPNASHALSGPGEKLDPARWPVRGDLAHIALAGRVFVPHFAVPQPRAVKAGGARLHAAPDAGAAILRELPAGAMFDVLDVQGGWTWGICNGLEGPIGHVPVSQLEEPA